MNWLVVVVLAILIFYGFKGKREGFIKTVFTLFSLIFALFLTSTFSPYISKALQNNEKIYSYISGAVSKIVEVEKEDGTVTEQVEDIKELSLPNSLKNALIENNNGEVYKALAINSFKEYVNNYLTCVIINALSFILTFLIINIALFLISNTLDLISKLPIINGLNKSAGFIIGLIHGLVVIWVLCILLTCFGGSEWGGDIYKLINESSFLMMIYDNNLLLSVITNMAKVLF
ncbi:colicin V production protein [Mobilisporobacter senegalensis]|uniref:Colicin V production protein n=1 Tax=Mobilisporobacter senegalensis TaxID=1329262 RepID=A0A3N1XC60_9FIRM|nr:CvpA family protein [Mobilisporobacter senegalensis]ROR23608.1 colicin V production protein [Mobilisporobacter senegalensis]